MAKVTTTVLDNLITEMNAVGIGLIDKGHDKEAVTELISVAKRHRDHYRLAKFATAADFCVTASLNLDELIAEQEKVIENLELNSPESVGQLSNEIIYKTCLQFTQVYIRELYLRMEKELNAEQSADNNSESSASTI